jgi:hypothetical protein
VSDNNTSRVDTDKNQLLVGLENPVDKKDKDSKTCVNLNKKQGDIGSAHLPFAGLGALTRASPSKTVSPF